MIVLTKPEMPSRRPVFIPAVSEARKAELTEKGYYIEDMEKVWGPGWWSGQHRWMKKDGSDFQDGDTSDTANDAWLSADRYDREISLGHDE